MSEAKPIEAGDSRRVRPLRIAIFGFGTVGSSVARILIESKPEGLALTHVFNRNIARKRVSWTGPAVVWSEDADAVLASDVDVIVELVGGLDPVGAWVRKALEAGKSVVTANKKLIAYHGVELERLARPAAVTSSTARPSPAAFPLFPAWSRAWPATASSAFRASSTAPATSSSAAWSRAPNTPPSSPPRRPRATPKPTHRGRRRL